jgi:hypothetical protein
MQLEPKFTPISWDDLRGASARLPASTSFWATKPAIYSDTTQLTPVDAACLLGNLRGSLHGSINLRNQRLQLAANLLILLNRQSVLDVKKS